MSEKKMTIAETLAEIIATYDLSADHKAFLEERIEKAKRKSADRKPTEKQLKNAEMSNAILDFMADNPTTLYAVADLIKKVPELSALPETPSTSYVSALIKPLKDSGAIVRTESKGRAYFQYNSDYED